MSFELFDKAIHGEISWQRIGSVNVSLHCHTRVVLHHGFENHIQEANGDRFGDCDKPLNAVVAGRHSCPSKEVQRSIWEGVTVLVENIVGTWR